MTDDATLPTPRWASINETALHLGISRHTLRRMVAAEELTEHRLGKLIRFDLNEIDRSLRAETQPAAKAA
ncbi:MAG: Helix-turn-helix domain [Microbacterium sp.]|jgi:excisionase family DNA binding protein|nr:Helix-turn-helix domain [Microbacterium sp.]